MKNIHTSHRLGAGNENTDLRKGPLSDFGFSEQTQRKKWLLNKVIPISTPYLALAPLV